MAWANERISKRILLKVSSLLQRDLHDPRIGMVTITGVKLTKDRAECKILWSTLEEGGRRSAIAHALENATGYVQREVASILQTRTAPKLTFVFDPSVEGVERISRLLREAREKDEESIRARGDEPDESADDEPS